MNAVRADEEELWDLIEELRSVSERLTSAAEKHCQVQDEEQTQDADD